MPSPPTCEFVPYVSITGATAAVAFYAAVFGVARRLEWGIASRFRDMSPDEIQAAARLAI